MKHAGATTAGVYLGLVVDASGLWYLTVSVTDDGRGGARPQQGHGIEGLIGRMRPSTATWSSRAPRAARPRPPPGSPSGP